MSHQLFAIFSAVAINFIACTTPGPDFIIVLKNALLYHRSAALLTALGISMGIIFHCSYAIFILPHFFTYNTDLLKFARYAGACYLSYLSVSCFWSSFKRRHTSTKFNADPATVAVVKKRFIVQGLVCNVLNPKAVLFFISMFSIILAGVDSLSLKLLTTILVFSSNLLWFGLLAILFTRPKLKQRLQQIDNLFHYINWMASFVFLAFAAFLLTLPF